ERELIALAMTAARVTGGTTGLIARSGNIRLDMFERLVLADLVIADISVHNANVFYELGIRDALRDRPTILIRFKRPDQESAAHPDEVPFDLKTDRYLEYDLTSLAASVPAPCGGARGLQERLSPTGALRRGDRGARLGRVRPASRRPEILREEGMDRRADVARDRPRNRSRRSRSEPAPRNGVPEARRSGGIERRDQSGARARGAAC